MVLRTARRGRNAGGQFYGCSQYPKCKGTLNLKEAKAPLTGERSSTPTGFSGEQSGRSDTDDLPRRVCVAASTPRCQVLIFEGIGVPREATAALAEEPLTMPLLRSLCQWKLEIPFDPTTNHALDSAAWQSVVEKLLMRGRTVPISPSLEANLADIADGTTSATPKEWLAACAFLACLDRKAPVCESDFDSTEERDFYNVVTPTLGGDHLRGWMSRQVSLGGLTGIAADVASNQRVDFVFAHPRGPNVVVEIDGPQHAEQEAIDAQRDLALGNAGLDVIRIPTHEIQKGGGPKTEELKTLLGEVTQSGHEPITSLHKRALLAKRSHQVQVSLLRAFLMGVIRVEDNKRIRVHVRLDDIWDQPLADRFTDAVIGDFNELIADVAEIHDEQDCMPTFQRSDESDADVVLSFHNGGQDSGAPTLCIKDIYLPVSVENLIGGAPTRRPNEVPQEATRRLLTRVFGFEDYREGQFEAIERCLQGKDTILLLPTGAGKSVAYQLASLLCPGICIVVDPIVSLIEDQVENLRAAGIDRASFITKDLV